MHLCPYSSNRSRIHLKSTFVEARRSIDMIPRTLTLQRPPLPMFQRSFNDIMFQTSHYVLLRPHYETESSTIRYSSPVSGEIDLLSLIRPKNQRAYLLRWRIAGTGSWERPGSSYHTQRDEEMSTFKKQSQVDAVASILPHTSHISLPLHIKFLARLLHKKVLDHNAIIYTVATARGIPTKCQAKAVNCVLQLSHVRKIGRASQDLDHVDLNQRRQVSQIWEINKRFSILFSP